MRALLRFVALDRLAPELRPDRRAAVDPERPRELAPERPEGRVVERVDREPLAERARDVRGEADVRDAMAGTLPVTPLKTQQSHAQHALLVARG